MLLQKVKSIFFVLPALITGMQLRAQVSIDHPIRLTATDTANAQIRNISFPTDSTQLVSASTYQMAGLLMAESSSSMADSILLTLPIAPGIYKQGLQIIFSVPMNNHDSVYVNVNGLGWKEMVYKKTRLNPDALKAGQMLSIVYDGSKMQILNEITNTCPVGFVEVSLGYCIEKNEHPTAIFFDAALACGQKNARLCSWNEWYFACQKTSLGLMNTTNNYEWVSDASNSNNQVLLLGNGNCTARTITLNSTSQTYRCCYSR